ncbi:hypothetical protein ACFFKU_04375 [Kineococcus gynurae]|uniref:Alkaline shock response membrane anchor protein AmaP n=1 Tax=Kineococcus gynurae TaxID=452979 RepID=A0ABV5LRG9_9ACTN
MSRSVIGLDRVLALLLGLVLLAGGAAVAVFGAGAARTLWAQAPDRISLGRGVVEAPSAGWWFGASAAFAVVAVVLGLWWLLAHLPRRGVSTLTLSTPGDASGAGRLHLDAAAPVEVAAEVLAETPGVRSARGSVITDRGELVYRLRAVVDPAADLAEVARSVEAVTADLATCVGRDDARSRVELSVARRAANPRRVA